MSTPQPSALQATLCIGAEHPALPGHFPGEPIVPGVLLLDETLHAIEAACGGIGSIGSGGSGDDGSGNPAGAAAGGWRLEVVKFHHLARPGQPLLLTLEPQPRDGLGRPERWAFRVSAAGRQLMSGRVTAR